MKKSLLIITAALFMTFPLVSFEWGGIVKEELKYSSSDFSLEQSAFRQSNTGILWFNQQFSPKGSWYLTSQVSYKYNFDFTLQNNNFNQILDLDLLKLTGKNQGGNFVLNTAFGRYKVSDLIGKVFSQSADGIYMNFSWPAFNMALYAGYTGFLNSLNVYMLDTKQTLQIGSDDYYSFAHKYLPLSLTFDFPNMFYSQSMKLQSNAFLDLESQNHRYYENLSLSGPFLAPFYYSFATSFETEDFQTFSNLTTLAFLFLIEDQFLLKVGADYASGNQLFLTPFKGFTSYSANYDFLLPELSGVILPSAQIRLNFKNMVLGFDATFYINFPEYEFDFEGVLGNADIQVNAFSDFQFSLNASYYYDFNDEMKNNYFTAGVNVTVSF